MVSVTNLGYPRIGKQRQLKRALEGYWSGKIPLDDLKKTGSAIRRENWLVQQQAGLDMIPCNDFSFYDHVLDTIAMLGAVPRRFGWKDDTVQLESYFAMARGGGEGMAAMEMTKWFNTNYHYIVPEFEPGMTFRQASTKVVDQFIEAKSLGINARPVLFGPVSFLLSGKSAIDNQSPLVLLGDLIHVYADLLWRLSKAGAAWVQVDEPFLVMDLDSETLRSYQNAYMQLGGLTNRPKILLATYFGGLDDNLPLALSLPVEAFHLDLISAPGQLAAALKILPSDKMLSLGVVDGRNVWREDIAEKTALVRQVVNQLGSERVMVAPSCSLMHVPQDLEMEDELDSEVKTWLAFARQKLDELAWIAGAVNHGENMFRSQFAANRAALEKRRTSTMVHNPRVAERQKSINADMLRRAASFEKRRSRQQECLGLPLMPATTIGSFPQTKEIRQARARMESGQISLADYEKFIRLEMERTIRFQEDVGLDVLVHGEFERNDMVQYFGEQLDGFAFTRHGWVQSFGSRYVRPPILFGDVWRPAPMTVNWAKAAQSLTVRPVKGMLTGPITILQWSFVRNDQPRSETCRQIALAIRDEVLDLESAGLQIIQIDEPALREGLPLRRADWQAYLDWAVECFKLSSSAVKDGTQIHTHMCYAEFNDIVEAIAAMDADVISIEASRSKMELLNAFTRFHYPNDVGPGVYDVHSPRIPSTQEMMDLLRRAQQVIAPRQLWVNPDCGLKTRGWPETEAALRNMVAAARQLRQDLHEL